MHRPRNPPPLLSLPRQVVSSHQLTSLPFSSGHVIRLSHVLNAPFSFPPSLPPPPPPFLSFSPLSARAGNPERRFCCFVAPMLSFVVGVIIVAVVVGVVVVIAIVFVVVIVNPSRDSLRRSTSNSN